MEPLEGVFERKIEMVSEQGENIRKISDFPGIEPGFSSRGGFKK